MAPAAKFYVVAFQHELDNAPDPNEDVWTISTVPGTPGWVTDGGYNGYGLNKATAEILAGAANAHDELLDALQSCSDQLYDEYGTQHWKGSGYINDLLAKHGRKEWWLKNTT